jgi:probable rRNA maturation factor
VRDLEPLLDALYLDAERALEAVARAGAEVAILLTDDAGIQALNLQWRGRDAPTDVLSFPSGGPGDLPVDLLGDVVISVETAARQAAERGHVLADELRVLLAHGLAHLLGHDHHDPDEAAAMRELERALLGAIYEGPAPVGLVAHALGPGP